MTDNHAHNEVVAVGHNLKKYYSVKPSTFSKHIDLKALDGVSFELKAGKTLAVVGESGCGKSTLARLLTFIEEPTQGQLSINGQNVDSASNNQIKQLRKSVQMIFQDPYGSLNPRKNVGSILSESLKINTSLDAKSRNELVVNMLEKVGLRAEHISRYPHMFSGGQRQRIAIARALMLKPTLVVADEPVSALDISIQAQVLNLLMDLQDELNTAYVFISHGLSVVEHIADEVMVMYLGRPVEQGTRDAIFGSPQHPYTQALLASTPFVDPDKRAKRVALKGELPSPLDPPSGCAFHQRCPYAMDQCNNSRPELKSYQDRLIACFKVE
ncbi:MAG: dipeptide ABC transporter ATP-binding protein [Gammaproteobacteria bacterium]|nr:dipeptide ABC transporter ATP-binding protein [Gammaproteobacteria bacterium]